ncbi:MAG: 50S ribosomal protein L29 [Candidatus Omnitrophota bacterium]
MKMQELTALSKEELTAKIKSLKEELFKLNAQRYAGSLEKPHMFSVLKRTIARANTLLNKKDTK